MKTAQGVCPSPGGQTTEQVSIKGKAGDSKSYTVLDSVPQLPITKHVILTSLLNAVIANTVVPQHADVET